MSTSDDTDGLRPRYGCKFTSFLLTLRLQTDLCSCTPPPQKKPTSRRVSVTCRKRSAGRALFLTACLQPHYGFRVFIIKHPGVEREGGRRPAFYTFHNFSPHCIHVGLYSPSCCTQSVVKHVGKTAQKVQTLRITSSSVTRNDRRPCLRMN